MNQQQLAQNGVDVGQCGIGGYPAAGLGNCNQPALSQNLAPDCSVYQECMVPYGFRFGVDIAGRIYRPEAVGLASTPEAFNEFGIGDEFTLFAPRGIASIGLIRVFTEPGVATFTSLFTGDLEVTQVNDADVATYNTDVCGCWAPFGCFSVTNPLRIRARSISSEVDDEDRPLIQEVSGCCWCTRQSAVNSCGPIATCPPVVPYAPAQVGQPIALTSGAPMNGG